MSPVLNRGSSVEVDVGAAQRNGSAARQNLAPARALTLSFFDELAAGFDPIVVGIAGERKPNATLRDEVGTETDFVVGGLDDLFGRGSFFGVGGCGTGRRFFPWNGALFLWFRGCGFCFGLWFRNAVRRRCGCMHARGRHWIFCFDFRFPGHVTSNSEGGGRCKRILQTGCAKRQTSNTVQPCDTSLSAGSSPPWP